MLFLSVLSKQIVSTNPLKIHIKLKWKGKNPIVLEKKANQDGENPTNVDQSPISFLFFFGLSLKSNCSHEND